MAVERYTVEHDASGGSITVDIDFDFSFKYGNDTITMLKQIDQMANFWITSPWRLKYNNQNTLHTFLKDLCREVLTVALIGNYNMAGVIDKFKNKEGYCALDGSSGIKLILMTEMNLEEQDEFEITKIL